MNPSSTPVITALTRAVIQGQQVHVLRRRERHRRPAGIVVARVAALVHPGLLDRDEGAVVTAGRCIGERQAQRVRARRPGGVVIAVAAARRVAAGGRK